MTHDPAETLLTAFALVRSGSTRDIDRMLSGVWPSREGPVANLDPTTVDAARDIPPLVQSVRDAAARGELTPSECVLLYGLLEANRRALKAVAKCFRKKGAAHAASH